jgi:hypothetical protein
MDGMLPAPNFGVIFDALIRWLDNRPAADTIADVEMKEAARRPKHYFFESGS